MVEGEILPRLRLLHRLPSRDRSTTRQPTAEETERLHALLLAPAPVDLAAEVALLLGGDMALATLLTALLIPAAHHLGALWEEDRCDFLTVTEGLGRLQVLTRRLCTALEVDTASAERSILLLPCPGESHHYALSIVASYFREAGWEVTTLDRAQTDASDLLRDSWFDAVGLSLACDVHLPALKAEVDALRRASCNPTLAIIVGGPWFTRHGAEAEAVGADAYVADGQFAPRIVEALLDRSRMALAARRA
ncbi:cobalamin B12-binding domain-containing protein [Methylobacterium phyllosphaerae]